MCGIAAILNIRKQTPELREKALAMAPAEWRTAIVLTRKESGTGRERRNLQSP